MSILPTIRGHGDLVLLTPQQQAQLCHEIRQFLIDNISQTGGHLASNLGVVELTVALETVFDTNKDRLVFDVGHQSYVHKLLTGRQADFSRLRQFGGIAGFPKPSESQTDAFVAGHASSSVSIALGMARARSLTKDDYEVCALIGDGAATGGMVYEALCDAAESGEKLIVVLNDNEMSIDRNVGGMAKHLSHIRSTSRYLGLKNRYRNFLDKIPGGKALYRFTSRMKNRLKRLLLKSTIFDNIGFTYLGPIDGHDLQELIALLRSAREINGPVLLHVVTQKGRGYKFAEEKPSQFHGVGKFRVDSGEILSKGKESFSNTFGLTLTRLAKDDPRICAITAAMPGGTGLIPFMKAFPQRIFDVGIAEEHAVSMAGGLAKQGLRPIVAIYSTFLQRSFDQLLQDIAMLRLPVIFGVDRAGLVGEDGETHHGVFDVGYLRQVPNMKILCPASCAELEQMLTWALKQNCTAVALRYPRGGDGLYKESAWRDDRAPVIHSRGEDATVITYGTMINQVLEAAGILAEQGVNLTVIRLLDLDNVDMLSSQIPERKPVFVVEETMSHSGISGEIARTFPRHEIIGLDLGEQYVTHGAIEQLYHAYGLDAKGIAKSILMGIHHEN